MNLKEKINNDLKDAMKSGDKTRLAVVRSIRALILEFEKSGIGRELNSEDELQMLTTAAKKRKDSIEQFRNAGRNDLADQEEKELIVLQEYLPKQLNEDEIKTEVARLASQIGAKSKEDFSKLMPLVMKELKGKADGKIVKSIVENFLATN
ncbi:MAG: GatB/YqeY domain-containing protein [Ignavibacterium sp.]|nr:GatB/YqeY domain-containing protein [Ignavibacterium sp.]MEB2354993.1 GatB/YqeY domain-containing protein [Ignavibacteriales bacterium]GIK22840.1 MAG: aspartyl-tRNA amidotransferase subunit B [Ignavibacteriota bacterium]